jgi:Leucine-rich repeat (LRR) protein
MTGLQQLWLGRNRISQVQGLQALTNLRKISLQSNRCAAARAAGAMHIATDL